MKNILPFAFLILIAVSLISACNKDDEPTNKPPVIVAQTFTASEDITISNIIGVVTAKDTNNDALTFSIVTNDNALFAMSKSGELRLAQGKFLDFEIAKQHSITVSVNDGSDNASTKITINVTNVDEAPIIEPQSFSTAQSIDSAEMIGQVFAEDPEGNMLSYSITENDNNLFEITDDGILSLTDGAMLDFDTTIQHNITVSVSDGAMSASGEITINVTEIEEDNKTPNIENQTFEADENISDDTVIGIVLAEDNEADILIFSILENDNNLFEIGETDGELSLDSGKMLDFEIFNEIDPVHSIMVRVSDGNTFADAQVNIEVGDINEAPEVSEYLMFVVAENITSDFLIGMPEVTDPEDGNLIFEISENDNDLFEITADGQLSLVNGQTLNFEIQDNHTITIMVTDGNNSIEFDATISVTNINEPPEVANTFNFEALELIQEDFIIGTVEALDPEGDNLEYEITVNDNGLFEIDNNGQISLIQGKSLNINMDDEHLITVQVRDAEFSLETSVTINVIQTLVNDPNSFVTNWEVLQGDLTIRISLFQGITLPIYDFVVEWGDGTVEQLVINQLSDLSHTYPAQGAYTVAIKGVFPSMRMRSLNEADRDKLLSVEQWGTLEWISLFSAFSNCFNVVVNAQDLPDLSRVEHVGNMFNNIASINADISSWETENIQNMGNMFMGINGFDQNLGSWNISNVTNMSGMFDNSGLSSENYSATLVGWASQSPNIQPNVTLGATGINYCSNYPGIVQAIETLTVTHGWTISDAGDVNCN